jgi:SAM-dependent methyltransferase
MSAAGPHWDGHTNLAPPSAAGGAYDRIAQWYDVDMARSMAFDDVALYVDLARCCGGRVVEQGCGNGRILLELWQAGVDAIGIDRSANMLRALCARAAARSLTPRVAQMDIRALALGGRHALVLCPYSLVTYLTSAQDVSRWCAEARRVLAPGGALVVDAFIPRETAASAAFREDYRRPCNGGELARAKRVTPLHGGLNRIERRYELRESGRVVSALETTETIRPYAPEVLVAAFAPHGFAVEESWWDYGAARDAASAQFFTVLAR